MTCYLARKTNIQSGHVTVSKIISLRDTPFGMRKFSLKECGADPPNQGIDYRRKYKVSTERYRCKIGTEI